MYMYGGAINVLCTNFFGFFFFIFYVRVVEKY